LRTLFDFNVKNTTRGTDNESGTGLGLVLVKDLIDKMEWFIEVKSKVNEGSEFIITILN
jgi:two-component system, sensor histidine kinase and response regulator